MTDRNKQNEEALSANSTGVQATSLQRKPQKPQSGLLALIGAGKPDFESIEEIDAFIRAERATWSPKTWSS